MCNSFQYHNLWFTWGCKQTYSITITFKELYEIRNLGLIFIPRDSTNLVLQHSPEWGKAAIPGNTCGQEWCSFRKKKMIIFFNHFLCGSL